MVTAVTVIMRGKRTVPHLVFSSLLGDGEHDGIDKPWSQRRSKEIFFHGIRGGEVVGELVVGGGVVGVSPVFEEIFDDGKSSTLKRGERGGKVRGWGKVSGGVRVWERWRERRSRYAYYIISIHLPVPRSARVSDDHTLVTPNSPYGALTAPPRPHCFVCRQRARGCCCIHRGRWPGPHGRVTKRQNRFCCFLWHVVMDDNRIWRWLRYRHDLRRRGRGE